MLTDNSSVFLVTCDSYDNLKNDNLRQNKFEIRKFRLTHVSQAVKMMEQYSAHFPNH